jgi:hypothetical protein
MPFSVVVSSDAVTISHVGTTMWSEMYDIETFDDYAYCLMRHGLAVFDVQNPGTPVLIAELGIPDGLDYYAQISVLGNYAYIASGNSAFIIADISDPTNPLELGRLELPEDVRYIAASEGSVYIGLDDIPIIYEVDVSAPLSPVVTNEIIAAGPVMDLCVANDLLFVADGILEIYDLSAPGGPAKISTHNPGQTVNAVCVVDDRAYIKTQSTGMMILDVIDPGNSVELGYYESDYGIADIQTVGNHTFLDKQTDGFEIIDVGKSVCSGSTISSRSSWYLNPRFGGGGRICLYLRKLGNQGF